MIESFLLVKKEDKTKVLAETYIAQPRWIKNKLKSSKHYISYLIEGAKEHCLSEKYIQKLQTIECID